MATVTRCNHCFAEKEVSELFKGSDIACCRSCVYKVKQVLDFLSYYGVDVVVSDTGELPTDPPGDGAEASANSHGGANPPTPHKSEQGRQGRKKT